jgi:hypothetical protein
MSYSRVAGFEGEIVHAAMQSQNRPPDYKSTQDGPFFSSNIDARAVSMHSLENQPRSLGKIMMIKRDDAGSRPWVSCVAAAASRRNHL